MGKKKSSRRARLSDSDADESASVTSTSTFTNYSDWGADDVDTIQDNPFETHIDALYEKRASTREKGLQGLNTLLASSYCYDDCVIRQETVSQMLLGCLRRGGATEAQLAARGLGLHVITLGASDASERILSDALPVLQLVAANGKTPAVRAAAIDTWALLVFIAGDGPAALLENMNKLRVLVNASTPKVSAAALEGWTLLLSILPQRKLTAKMCDQHMELFADRLHDENVEVRAAAGGAAALLYSASGGACGDAQDYDGNTVEDPFGDSLQASVSGMDEIVARMKDLATNRGDRSRRSKRDRASLRSTFRELCHTVEEGMVREAKVKLRHGDVLYVDTLAGIVQLNYIRRFLSEGFQVHLMENPLLHQVFNFVPRGEPQEKLSRLEKRIFRSPASAENKARTQSRGKARAATSAFKQSIMGVDEY